MVKMMAVAKLQPLFIINATINCLQLLNSQIPTRSQAQPMFSFDTDNKTTVSIVNVQCEPPPCSSYTFVFSMHYVKSRHLYYVCGNRDQCEHILYCMLACVTVCLVVLRVRQLHYYTILSVHNSVYCCRLLQEAN